jgi:alkanesulfonate monooxygenase
MSLEILGMIGTQHRSEIHQNADGPAVDPGYVQRFVRAHENSDFDRVLIGYSSGSPDGTQVASYAAAHSDRLGFLIAHRPGFVFPTVAARTFATLDQFTGGRVAFHTISGASDAEQLRDGDHTTKEQRYARTREFLQVLKQSWTSTTPFDFHGEFYDLDDFLAHVKPLQQPRIPVYFGGSSPAAYQVGGAEADVFMLFGQPTESLAEEIESVRAVARAAGRETMPDFSVSFRPILGATEDLAWKRAHEILDRTKAELGSFLNGKEFRRDPGQRSAGSQRQLDAAAAGSRHGAALWTEIAAATGAGGNSTALVGTPETVAEALMEYVDLGVGHILMRGFDPFDDAVDYGRELIPRLRELAAARDRSVDPRELVATH